MEAEKIARELREMMIRTLLDDRDRLKARVEELEAGWQPIETAPKDGTSALFFWPNIPTGAASLGASLKLHHGIAIGRFEYDDEFDERPKSWVSPQCGFRMEGDKCIPVNQSDCRYWRHLPAPPSPGQSLPEISPSIGRLKKEDSNG